MKRDEKKLEVEEIRSKLNVLSEQSEGAGLPVLSRLIDIARDQADDDIGALGHEGNDEGNVDVEAMRRQGALLSGAIAHRKADKG